MAETPESPKKLPFDEAIVSRFRDLIHELLTDYPELRTVGIVLDWNGPLNDAAIKAGQTAHLSLSSYRTHGCNE